MKMKPSRVDAERAASARNSTAVQLYSFVFVTMVVRRVTRARERPLVPDIYCLRGTPPNANPVQLYSGYSWCIETHSQK